MYALQQRAFTVEDNGDLFIDLYGIKPSNNEGNKGDALILIAPRLADIGLSVRSDDYGVKLGLIERELQKAEYLEAMLGRFVNHEAMLERWIALANPLVNAEGKTDGDQN